MTFDLYNQHDHQNNQTREYIAQKESSCRRDWTVSVHHPSFMDGNIDKDHHNCVKKLSLSKHTCFIILHDNLSISLSIRHTRYTAFPCFSINEKSTVKIKTNNNKKIFLDTYIYPDINEHPEYNFSKNKSNLWPLKVFQGFVTNLSQIQKSF